MVVQEERPVPNLSDREWSTGGWRTDPAPDPAGAVSGRRTRHL
jgi:hypothetical protein